jgi:hypothetical protein
MELILSGAAALLHIIAAVLSLRLIRITGHYTAWIFLSIGIALAAVRRAVTFFRLLSGDLPYIDLLDVATAFSISVFFLTGIIVISPLFASLRDSDKFMKLTNDNLEQENVKSNRLIVDLKEALANVRTLRGMLPICASCKKIRDDAGYWKQIESYITDHSEAAFSHGICPECFKKLYPDITPHGEDNTQPSR